MRKVLLMAFVACLCACTGKKEQADTCCAEGMKLLDAAAFTKQVDGKDVSLYTLKSEGGLTVQITNYGARIVTLFAADKEGKYADVNLGYENIDRYVDNDGERYIGCIVGRYANRIAKGQFEIDGQKYQLNLNNNGNALHAGGLKGFDKVVWTVDNVTDNKIELSYVSPDGEDFFPGTVTTKVTYTLTPENAIEIDYNATTDKPTVLNLTNHAFFNLKGESNGTITDHILYLNASQTTAIDSLLIPTGEFASVDGTPFDFRTPTVIGERIDADNEQIKFGSGYDHNWVIDRKTEREVELAGSLYEPVSGRLMEIYTDQPGIQFYSGNFFKGINKDKNGKTINYREALALETQKYPDSPNQPNFPTTRVNPGETYTQKTIYKFSVK